MRAGHAVVHAAVRGALVFLAAALLFGQFAAYLAALCAAALVPYEAWCRTRRWRVRCLAVLGAWPLTAALAMGLPYHAVYAQTLSAGGWGRARQALGEGLSTWPADPPISSALTPLLESLPWFDVLWFVPSYVVLETSAALASLLTLVVFGSVFLARDRPTAADRGWQALAGGTCGAVLGLALWCSHPPLIAGGLAMPVPPLRSDPLWLWAYLILVGSTCPLAAVISDWLTGLPRARSVPDPHTAPPGAARAGS